MMVSFRGGKARDLTPFVSIRVHMNNRGVDRNGLGRCLSNGAIALSGTLAMTTAYRIRIVCDVNVRINSRTRGAATGFGVLLRNGG